MISALKTPLNWPLFAALFSAAMLAAAHGFERFGRMLPCPLCLDQREVYWVALTVGVAGSIVFRIMSKRWLVGLFNLALALIFAIGAAIAIFHAGAEYGFWDGPAECAAGGGSLPTSIDELNLDQKFAVSSCTDVPWSLFGISMAGYNALLSILFASFSLFFSFAAFKKEKAHDS